MFSTLAVSKLSGWLKEVASCRVRGGVERRDAQLLGGRSDGSNLVLCAKCASGGGQGPCTQRVCGEQTANIPFMLVTPDVSKFSGWLNADAYCQGSGFGLGLGLGLGL